MAQTAAGDALSITIGGKDGLPHAGSGQEIGKNIVHYNIYVFKYISSMHPLLIKGCGGGDGEIITLVPVPFRIDTVEGEGKDGKGIGVDGVFRPGCIYFGGYYIFDIIFIEHVVIFGRGVVWQSVVYNSRLLVSTTTRAKSENRIPCGFPC